MNLALLRAVLLPARLAVVQIQRGFFLVYGFISYCRSLLRSRRDFIEERWEGADDLAAARRVVIFNHFDRQGRVHGFVRHYLRELRAAGYCILFVSNAPRLEADALDYLKGLCGLVTRRANVGRDFGAYKDGIALLPDRSRLESLILANDSVYGPFSPLGDILARIDWGRADLWGMADSWDRRYHLQSFFLVFGPRALASPAFQRFWDRVRHVQSKAWIIQRYEVGLTSALLAGGLRCRALFPYRTLVAALLDAVRQRHLLTDKDLNEEQVRHLRQLFYLVNRGIPTNPTHAFWDHLISVMGFPFLKRELLRENPMGLPFLAYWERVVQSASDYDTQLIDDHLKLSLRDRNV